MGPVMNILLAVVVMAIVLAQGAEVPALSRSAARRRRREARFAGGKSRIAARRSRPGGGWERGPHLGSASTWRSGPAPIANCP